MTALRCVFTTQIVASPACNIQLHVMLLMENRVLPPQKDTQNLEHVFTVCNEHCERANY